MKEIIFRFNDGTTQVVEVSDEFYETYQTIFWEIFLNFSILKLITALIFIKLLEENRIFYMKISLFENFKV